MISPQATATGDAGDLKTAKTHSGVSIVCTAVGWVSAVLGVIVIVGAVLGSIFSYVNSPDY